MSGSSVTLRRIIIGTTQIIGGRSNGLVFPDSVRGRHSFSNFSLLKGLTLPRVEISRTNHSVSTASRGKRIRVHVGNVLTGVRSIRVLSMTSVVDMSCVSDPNMECKGGVTCIVSVRAHDTSSNNDLNFGLAGTLAAGLNSGSICTSIGENGDRLGVLCRRACISGGTSRCGRSTRCLLRSNSRCRVSQGVVGITAQGCSGALRLGCGLTSSTLCMFRAALAASFDGRPCASGRV